MDKLFGKRKTPEEMLRQNQRALNKAMRDLDRERVKMENQEKKVIADIKKMAKQGQMVCWSHFISFLVSYCYSSHTSALSLATVTRFFLYFFLFYPSRTPDGAWLKGTRAKLAESRCAFSVYNSFLCLIWYLLRRLKYETRHAHIPIGHIRARWVSSSAMGLRTEFCSLTLPPNTMDA